MTGTVFVSYGKYLQAGLLYWSLNKRARQPKDEELC